jgi:hypothetical protein
MEIRCVTNFSEACKQNDLLRLGYSRPTLPAQRGRQLLARTIAAVNKNWTSDAIDGLADRRVASIHLKQLLVGLSSFVIWLD